LNYLSFLVDNLPLHYYQAELLLFSLEKFTSFNKNQIIVHCTTRVNDAFLFFLKENKYEYRVIEPYLDGKYCNKLQQLPTFDFLTDKDAVFLVDADTFFLNDPILAFSSKIGGKVVDAPNPPLSVLSKIFNEANLSYPKIVPSDWVMENAYTFECNFNGGFYYIPGKDVEKANKLWRKWATWLYERSYLFDTEAQSIHIDQVSFAMMVQEGNFDYQVVVSNNNSPIHKNTKQRLFDDSNEVSMLHYHRSLNAFGLLETSLSINNIVDKAIGSINEAIVEKGNFEFYKQFNKSFIIPSTSTIKTKKFEKKLLDLDFKYLNKKIIFHAGTPKTGTTSLQFLLDSRYEELLQQGILYPKYYLDINPPKHQWLVQLLRANNFDGLFEYLEKILREAKEKQVETIFLSTEGIFNHWWDFSAEAKEVLQLISKKMHFELYVVFREPSSFLESFYKQNLKNPQNSAARCYGQDWSFEAMMKDKWFIKHIDYLGFLQELENLFGKESVRVFTYSKEIVETLLKNMGFASRPDLNAKKENLGQSSIGVELLRVLNQYNVNAKDKKEVVNMLKKMDVILAKYNSSPLFNQEIERRIKELYSLQSNILNSEYGLEY